METCLGLMIGQPTESFNVMITYFYHAGLKIDKSRPFYTTFCRI